MSRIASISIMHRRWYHGAVRVPAGAIVAWEGEIADIPNGWGLCDGTNDTPNLGGRYAMGQDGTYEGAGGDDFSVVGVTVASAGAHTGSSASVVSYNTQTVDTGTTAAASSAGAHTHTVAGSADYDPPHCKLAYIMAAKDAPLPSGAIVWLDAESPGDGYIAYSDLQDRFIKGQADDTRGQDGAEDFTYSLAGFSSAGSHDHGPLGNNPSGSSGSTHYKTNTVAGAHTHDDLADQPLTVSRPPFIALLAAQTNRATGAIERLILAYAGEVADLPEGWFEANGDNNTRDCRGKAPVGAGGSYSVGDTGGDMNNVSGAILTGSKTVSHSHTANTGYLWSATANKYHAAYDWVHAHSVAFEFKKQIPWFGITFIEYLGV